MATLHVRYHEVFLVTLFGRLTFEVTEEEYQQAMTTAFKLGKPPDAWRISWHAGCMDGTYKQTSYSQALEEVKVSGNRT